MASELATCSDSWPNVAAMPRDPDDRPLSPEARVILCYAEVATLKADAAVLSALYASLDEAGRQRLRTPIGADG